jgi:uncharacterized hydrophobic protein (TIGR00271 family)
VNGGARPGPGPGRRAARLDRPLRRWHGRRGALDAEERRAILDELFFEGPAFVPYLYRLTILMGLASVIGALGLIADSAAVVIGAMLVAPLMTPLMAFAGSLTMGWSKRQLEAGMLVLLASAESVAVAWAVSAIVPAFRPVFVSHELLTRTEPRLLDLAIAIAAGAAGAYVTVRRQSAGALPGVAIAVALVPPLAAVGVLLEVGRPHLATGALLLFATNLVAIVLAAALVFLLTGFVPAGIARRHGRRITLGLATTVLAVGAVAYPLQQESRTVLATAQSEEAVGSAVADWLDGTDLQVSGESVSLDAGRLVASVDVVGPKPPPPAATLARLVRERSHRPVDLTVRWTERRQEQAHLDG